MFTILLQTSDTGAATDPISLFVQYGIAGLVIVALLMGLLWAKPAVDGIIKRAERAEQQRDDLLKVYEDKMLPAMNETISINKELKPVLIDVITTNREVKSVLSDAIRSVEVIKDQVARDQGRPLRGRNQDG